MKGLDHLAANYFILPVPAEWHAGGKGFASKGVTTR